MAADLRNAQEVLNELGKTLKLDFDSAISNNPNFGPEANKSDFVKKIESEIKHLEKSLEDRQKGPLGIIQGLFTSKRNAKVQSKLADYTNLLREVSRIETELNNIKTVISSHGDKMSESTKDQLIKNLNGTIANGQLRLQKASEKISNPEIKSYASRYQSALEQAAPKSHLSKKM